MNELYEGKIKKLKPKNIKIYAEVLQTRNGLKALVNALSNTFEK